jgi:hypothetical protein
MESKMAKTQGITLDELIELLLKNDPQGKLTGDLSFQSLEAFARWILANSRKSEANQLGPDGPFGPASSGTMPSERWLQVVTSLNALGASPQLLEIGGWLACFRIDAEACILCNVTQESRRVLQSDIDRSKEFVQIPAEFLELLRRVVSDDVSKRFTSVEEFQTRWFAAWEQYQAQFNPSAA